MLTMSQPESSNTSSFTNTYPSNFSSFNYTYHVFLSFRGSDTRYGFTGHLYQALSEKGIHTFMDDEELRKGEEITPALLKAIEESWIAIVVLSKDYASSTFCLQELVKILECVMQKGRLVLPIFYRVNPSDVRHMKESYGEAFIKHEARFANDKEKVKRWKEALQEVSMLSGWHLPGSEYEHVHIKKIVEELSIKTHRIILHVAEYPVGLKCQVTILRSILNIESNERVIMAGIYGIGGIGKTTIARAMYNLIAHQFEGACFLANVRERSNQNNGLIQLQEQLLHEIVGGNNIKWSDVYRGIPIMKQMLNKKKVLLILDDVVELNQLQTLAGGLDWFGSRSRIIITTRDEHLLDAHGVKRKYMVEALNDREAFKLLTWNAFKSNRIHASYQGILNEFVRYCNGLPLALEVIGSTLFGKRLHEWESALATYKKVPNRNIQEVLKVSYDHLDENEKGIFLDMACFFGGCKLEYAQHIIRNGHDLHPKYGVGVLIKRSLIKICSGCIVMHDLIRDMGIEIVRQESPHNPGKRSRLWYYEDIRDVFEEDKGTGEIEVIILNAPRDIKVQWDGNALEKMKNLRILIVKNACFSCGPKHLPNSLRILDWEQYPSSSLPSDYHPRKLIILNLNRSCLILNKPFQHFESLSEIDLRYSNFETVPSISGAPNLRKMILDKCTNLMEVDDSIGLLDRLETLSAYGCTKLRIFPEVIRSTSLEKLDLTGCSSLLNFPGSLGIMEMITHLDLRFDQFAKNKSEALVLIAKPPNFRLDSETFMYAKLDKLIKGSSSDSETFMFAKLDKLIKGSSSVPALNVTSLAINSCYLGDRFPSQWFPCFPNLLELDLSNNDEIDQFLSKGLPWFPNLQSLRLSYSSFTILPECIKELHYLRYLYLDYCKQLGEIRGVPPNIKILSATNCISLSDQSTGILMSQAIHKVGGTTFILPGERVPEWFAYKQPLSQSLSFWVRNELPEKIAICVVCFDIHPLYLSVNGIRHGPIFFPTSLPRRKPHIHLVHLERGRHFIGEVTIGHGWNHVQVLLGERVNFPGNVLWMGVHLYKEGNSAENVRFSDPNPGKEKTEHLSGTNKKVLDAEYAYWGHDQKWKGVWEFQADYFNDTNSNHAFRLIKKRCWRLDMEVLDVDRPLKYDWHWDNISWKGVRDMQALIKVKFLMWKVSQKALPTSMNLFRRKIINSPLCPICKIECETNEHVFMYCKWTQPVWFGSDLQWCVDDDLWWSYGFGSWLHRKMYGRHVIVPPNISMPRMDGVIAEGQPRSKIMGTVGNICWAIWKGRNEHILEDKPVDPELALFRVKTLCKQYSHYYPLVQSAVKSTDANTHQVDCSTHYTGQMIENDNKARGKSVLMASSHSNTKENIGQDGLSSVHNLTWDAPITSSTSDNVETEQVREPKSNIDTSDSIIMDRAIHNEHVRERTGCESNTETKKGEASDSIIMDTAIHNEQLTAERKKRKGNSSRCSSVRYCKKPRVDKGKSTTNQCTKWKRNPMHLRLSRQLLQQYKPVFRKGSQTETQHQANC